MIRICVALAGVQFVGLITGLITGLVFTGPVQAASLTFNDSAGHYRILGVKNFSTCIRQDVDLPSGSLTGVIGSLADSTPPGAACGYQMEASVDATFSGVTQDGFSIDGSGSAYFGPTPPEFNAFFETSYSIQREVEFTVNSEVELVFDLETLGCVGCTGSGGAGVSFYLGVYDDFNERYVRVG